MAHPYPIKAVADRQAVEIQELLEAFTAPARRPAPNRHPPGFKQIPEFDAPMLSSVLFPSEPAVIASEPFKIADAPALPPGLPPLNELPTDRFAPQPTAALPAGPSLEEAHESLIPAALNFPAELDESHRAQ